MTKILSFFVAIGLATTVFAQIQPDLVVKKGVDIEINGLEDDAIWALIEPVSILKPFNANPGNPLGAEIPTLGEPGETYFKMFYTDEFIYVLINVNDDVLVPYWNSVDFPNKPGDSWKYDKAEFYMDVNRILKDGQGPAWNAGVQDAGHHQFAPYIAPIVTRADGVSTYDDTDPVWGTVYENVRDNNWNAFSGNNTYAFSQIGTTGYVLEARFAISGLTNTDGDTFTAETLQNLPEGVGIDVTIADNDGSGRQRAVWMNDGPAESYNNMDNSGVAIFSEELIINPTTNIVENRMSSLRVYPNPAQNLVTVDANVDKIEVVNITGRLVMVVENSRTVNVNELPAGLYIFKTYENGSLNGVTKVTKR
jgi:hypothetical protein